MKIVGGFSLMTLSVQKSFWKCPISAYNQLFVGLLVALAVADIQVTLTIIYIQPDWSEFIYIFTCTRGVILSS